MAALLLYLIGARSAGKTAVFDALIQTPEGPHFATKGAHRLGTVKVPDPRLAVLRDLFQPKKYIPAEITFCCFSDGVAAKYRAALARRGA